MRSFVYTYLFVYVQFCVLLKFNNDGEIYSVLFILYTYSIVYY